MKKNELERALQTIPPLSRPKSGLEQYSTPAEVAADILFLAYSRGDIQEKTVLDLGCGNGIFSIGAALLGARDVVGVDVDREALAEAGRNARSLGVEVRFLEQDIRSLAIKGDTVIQNPPFGSQRRGADRPFLEAAMRSGRVVYSLHNEETLPFLRGMVESLGGKVLLQKSYKFVIPHMFAFHSKSKKHIEVVMLCISTGEEA
jgi:putative methylase